MPKLINGQRSYLEQRERVAFYGEVDGGGLNAGFDSGDTLTFNTTKANVGGGFNASTGTFTAPLNGMYMFSWGISFGNTTSDNTWIAIRPLLDGNLIASNSYSLGHVQDINDNQYDSVGGSSYIFVARGSTFKLQATFNAFTGDVNYGQFIGVLMD